MTTIALFNNQGGVGKTTLLYHLAHMWAGQGRRVLMVDFDPQANLTAMCLDEERLEGLWPEEGEHVNTVLGALRPVMRGIGPLALPENVQLDGTLSLLPGDLGLSAFETQLADAWPRAMDRDERSFRVLGAVHQLTLAAAQSVEAELVLIDVGPNLGALNRAVLLSASHLVTPLAPDLFSAQGLKNLGPTLIDWRAGWRERLARCPDPSLMLPLGGLAPLGYVVMQAGMRLSRPVAAYGRWVARMPGVFHRQLLQDDGDDLSVNNDPYCLGVMRNYQSLMPLAQDAKKPMFLLKPGDGAMGAHQGAVARCYDEFERLANTITDKLRAEREARGA